MTDARNYFLFVDIVEAHHDEMQGKLCADSTSNWNIIYPTSHRN